MRLRRRARANDGEAGGELVTPPEFADPAPPEPGPEFGPPVPDGYVDTSGGHFPAEFGPPAPSEADLAAAAFGHGPPGGDTSADVIPFGSDPDVGPGAEPPGGGGGAGPAGGSGRGVNLDDVARGGVKIIDAVGGALNRGRGGPQQQQPPGGPGGRQPQMTGYYVLPSGETWVQYDNQRPPRGAKALAQGPDGSWYLPEGQAPPQGQRPARQTPPIRGPEDYSGQGGDGPPQKKSSSVWLWVVGALALLGGS